MRKFYLIFYLVLIFSLPGINNAQVTSQKFTLVEDRDGADSYSTKSPKGAMVRSLIIPGWGQVYNGKIIKALVFLGGEAYFLSRYLGLNDELKILEDANAGERTTKIIDKEQERNGWGWLFAAGYLLAMGDAFVDAHLDGFSIDENLSVKLIRDEQKNGLLMRLKFNF